MASDLELALALARLETKLDAILHLLKGLYTRCPECQQEHGQHSAVCRLGSEVSGVRDQQFP